MEVFARHKHLNTTMRYIDINENKMRNAINLLCQYFELEPTDSKTWNMIIIAADGTH
jgi:hypothetical protein